MKPPRSESFIEEDEVVWGMMRTKLINLLESWDAGAWGEPTSADTGVSVLRSTNIKEGGLVSFENQAVLAIDDATLEKKRLNAGDILLERSGGGPLQPVGRVAGFWGSDAHDKFICGNFISRLVPKKEIVDSLYLLYALLNWHISGQTEKLQTATTGIRNLQMKQYLDNDLVVPKKIADQRRIASQLKSQLAAVEEARSAAQAQLAELERLRTTSLNQLFASSENCKAVGFAAKVQSGFAFKSQDFSPVGMRLLRNANVSPGIITWVDVATLPEAKSKGFDSYVVRDGDVIISLDRPIISSGIKVARVTAADLPCLLVQRVGRFLLDESLLDAAYLYAFLQTDRFKEAISGHEQSLGVPHISPGQVEAVEIPLPPLAEQQRIGQIAMEVLATTEEAKGAAMAMLADISILPSRLLAKAFDFNE